MPHGGSDPERPKRPACYRRALQSVVLFGGGRTCKTQAWRDVLGCRGPGLRGLEGPALFLSLATGAAHVLSEVSAVRVRGFWLPGPAAWRCLLSPPFRNTVFPS